ncbi:hypothetical protein [Corynebacterium glyciniphilum]|uniref:hypothetical protein n=1 Tax=Corynebacterium glyciniphilum TaxID=1404244 RepID=UPI0011AB43ED|nr:hypothetical protein [Corynebacterium glyciniphilum]
MSTSGSLTSPAKPWVGLALLVASLACLVWSLFNPFGLVLSAIVLYLAIRTARRGGDKLTVYSAYAAAAIATVTLLLLLVGGIAVWLTTA